MKGVTLCLVALFLFPAVTAALGITPAKVTTDFIPGEVQTYTFRVSTDDPSKLIDVYVEGAFSDYASLDTTYLEGGGSFTLTLDFPESFDPPGTHRLMVGVIERVDPEVTSTIGTRLSVRSPVDIAVPYPGRYLTLDLTTHDVNEGEPVQFNLNLENLGEESLTISPVVDVYSEDGHIDTVSFNERVLVPGEFISLERAWESELIQPGVYRAEAKVDYGITARDEAIFRVGTLSLRLINYSQEIIIGDPSLFTFHVASAWNNEILGAYAKIHFLDDSLSFTTTPSNIPPWSEVELEGYADTTNVTEGEHRANVTFVFFGDEESKQISTLVDFTFVDDSFSLSYPILAGALLMLVIIVIFIWWYYGTKKKH